MLKIHCNYTLHFTEIVQKYEEIIEIPGFRVADLISILDEKYKGLKSELIDAATGQLLTRNGIMLQRGEDNTTSISLLETQLQDGDIITFY